MTVRLTDLEWTGDVVDLRGRDVEPAVLVDAIRDPADDRVVRGTPGPAHEYVGWLRPGVRLDRRVAFAAVARSLGWTTSQDDDLVAVATELRELETASTDLGDARERAASAGSELDRLRERVAALRGAVRVKREEGLDADEEADELSTAATRLSEAATEREAALQELDRARAAAREAYDLRERRLELEDRAANLRRAARARLADRVRPRVAETLAELGETGPDGAPDALDGGSDPVDEAPDVLVALAAAGVAALTAPVVVELDRFGPHETADVVGTRVLYA